MRHDPTQQVIKVQVKRSNGCLWFLLFGWLYPAWIFAKWCAVTSWRLFVAYPWRACVALWRVSVRGARWFHARYGWRGWLVFAGVVVVLALIGKLTK